jgi:hypothetical protein
VRGSSTPKARMFDAVVIDLDDRKGRRVRGLDHALEVDEVLAADRAEIARLVVARGSMS